jgi:hypothetical protein
MASKRLNILKGKIWILAFLTGLVLWPVVAMAKTYPVTWEPKVINQTLGPGESVILSATFTSTDNLNNIDLWIVPELQPFVSVEPTHFDTIVKNVPVEITVRMSLPHYFETCNHDGTIHIKEKSRTVSQALKVNLKIADLFCPPKLYLTVVSHNEEPRGSRPDYTADRAFYLENRKLVKLLAKTIINHGGKFNFQSDWNYLAAVTKFDDLSITWDTNNKNIVRWMKEDLGAEIDPHAHESKFNYADVAFLIESLGITPSKNVGGFLYDPPDNPQGWEQHKEGIHGIIFPDYFWRADSLWGASTSNHSGNDDESSGIWRPKDRYNFYVDETSARLIYIGGCTQTQEGVKKLLEEIRTGRAPSDGFYTASIMMIQDFMTEDDILQLGAFIDSLSDEVTSGRIQWATLTEMADIWRSKYKEKAFRYDCSNYIKY